MMLKESIKLVINDEESKTSVKEDKATKKTFNLVSQKKGKIRITTRKRD